METDRLDSVPGACVPKQQHPRYGAACRAIGSEVRQFVLHDSRSLRGTAQVLVRRWPLLGRTALLARGPVWSPDLPQSARRAALSDLLRGLRQTHAGVVATPDRIGAGDPLDHGPWLGMVTPCALAVLDLTATPEAMRARQHGKWRNRLVKAEAAGLTVTDAPLPPDPAHWLLVAEEEQRCARGYRRLPSCFTTAWARAGGRQATRLFLAHRGGKPIAAMLFLLHPPGASYHIGWSGPEGRASGAHGLLLWHAALWLRARGYRTADLGTLDTDSTPGLARFKLGSGAQAVTLGATRLWAPGTAPVAALVRRVNALAPTQTRGLACPGPIIARPEPSPAAGSQSV